VNSLDRILEYERAYYEARDRVVEECSHFKPIFPEYLLASFHVVVIQGTDAIFVRHVPATQQSYKGYYFNGGRAELSRRFAPSVEFSSMGPCALARVTAVTNGRSVYIHKLEYFGSEDLEQYNQTLARAKAESEVLAFVVGALLEIESDLDPQERETRTAQALEALIDDYLAMLASDPNEERVQSFLNDNPILLSSSAEVVPKHRLGAEHVTDFVLCSGDAEYELVELERPNARLFTKAGDPHRDLTHGIRQLEDWLQWVSENLPYARTSLPGISEPKARLIIGRSSQLSAQHRNALRRRNAELNRIQIVTFDDLAETARGLLKRLKALEQGP
jgi:hypothetical protein